MTKIGITTLIMVIIVAKIICDDIINCYYVIINKCYDYSLVTLCDVFRFSDATLELAPLGYFGFSRFDCSYLKFYG